MMDTSKWKAIPLEQKVIRRRLWNKEWSTWGLMSTTNSITARPPDQRQPGGGPTIKGPPETLKSDSCTDSDNRLTDNPLIHSSDSFMDWKILPPLAKVCCCEPYKGVVGLTLMSGASSYQSGNNNSWKPTTDCCQLESTC